MTATARIVQWSACHLSAALLKYERSMEEVYEYREPGRGLGILLGVGLVSILLGVAWWGDAPWYIWMIWLTVAAILAFTLVTNRTHGLRITRSKMILSPWFRPQELDLREIAEVTVVEWSDGTDYEIRLKSDEVVSVFSGDMPPPSQLRVEMEKRGIPFERR